MNLEDHLGDIVAKGRALSRTPVAVAARAAGLGEPELQGLEASGRAPGGANWAGLGRAVGLDGGKLAAIAAGWTPQVPDLARWRELRTIVTDSGGMGVNCFLVWDEATRDAALFDTGWEAEPIVEQVAESGLQLRHIFITHAHGDHVAALGELRKRFPQARLHWGAAEAPPDQRLRPGDFVHLGSLRIGHRPTPGHADDGTTYIIGNWPDDAPYVAVVGDAIFAGSMGRGNPDWELARARVREQILTLPPETLLCPGHGPLSTVWEERAHNPFF